MRKILSLSTCALVIAVLACGSAGGKYGDVKSVMKQIIKAQESFFEKAESAKNADDLAAAINSFSGAMAKLKPQVEALEKKYPEMKKTETPAELKELTEKQKQLSQKMGPVMTKLMIKYGANPKVQKAVLDMGKASR